MARYGRPLRPLPDWLIIDPEDYEKVSKHNWFIDGAGYARGAKNLRIHQFILDIPKGMEADHINGNRLDNRRANLRIVTRRVNAQNCAPSTKNRTGVRGVWFVPDSRRRRARYKAQSRDGNGKLICVGTFKTLEEAAVAMREFRTKHHIGYVGRDRMGSCPSNKNTNREIVA